MVKHYLVQPLCKEREVLISLEYVGVYSTRNLGKCGKGILHLLD